jgi:hypothetical protein
MPQLNKDDADIVNQVLHPIDHAAELLGIPTYALEELAVNGRIAFYAYAFTQTFPDGLKQTAWAEEEFEPEGLFCIRPFDIRELRALGYFTLLPPKDMPFNTPTSRVYSEDIKLLVKCSDIEILKEDQPTEIPKHHEIEQPNTKPEKPMSGNKAKAFEIYNDLVLAKVPNLATCFEMEVQEKNLCGRATAYRWKKEFVLMKSNEVPI